MKFKYKIFILFFTLSLPVFSQYWEKINNIPVPYNSNYWLDVYFLQSDNSYGWICGFKGMILRTTDGGNTWRGSIVPNVDHLESIHFATAQIGYTSGVKGIWKTTNGGANWFSIKPSQAADSIHYWGTYFYDSNHGVLLGMGCGGSRQYFWRTTNGGSTWSLFNGDEFDSGLTDAIVLATGQGYAVSSGKLWRTSDYGSSWNVIATTGSNLWHEEMTYFNQSFLVPYAGIGCSGNGINNGGMRFSTNGGSTWRDVNVRTPMFGAFVLSPTEAWACGYNRAVYHTTDAGRTWQLKNCGIGQSKLDDIWFLSQNQAWLVGEGVYKLAAGKQNISKTLIDFEESCILKARYDTLYLENYNFTSVAASWQLQGTNRNDFRILEPDPYFTMPSCATQMLIVEFNPKTSGLKTANLRIEIPGFPTKIVGLHGKAVIPTATTKDTLIIVDNAKCGIKKIVAAKWKTSDNNSNEFINSYERNGSADVELATEPPVKLSRLGTDTKFIINPADTGWQSSIFDFILYPCDISKTVKIKFYGISPIINSNENAEIMTECKYYSTLEIPVSNTGNTDLHISKLEILAPASGFSISAWKSGYAQPRSLKPGEADTIIIKYAPTVPGINTAKLRITNDDMTSARGKKNPYDIKLKAGLLYTKLSMPDTVIDFGKICLGDSVDRLVKIANTGNLPAVITKILSTTNEIKLIPESNIYPIQIRAFDTLRAFVTFKPKYSGNFIDTLIIKTSPCNEEIRIAVKARVVKTNVAISPKKISGTVYNYGSDTAVVTISNNGNEQITITKYSFTPPLSNWNVKLIPTLPQSIDANKTQSFKLVFSTKQDNPLRAKICFEVEANCPVQLCADIDYQSSKKQIALSVNALDWGLLTCIPTEQRKKLKIRNLSPRPARIDSIYIEPNSQGFSLINTAKFPYYIAAGKNSEIEIAFKPPNQGNFNAELVVNNNISEVRINLTAEYKSPIINPLSSKTGFRATERCHSPISRTFLYRNTGMIADTLDVSFKPSASYYYADKKILVIPPADSAEITITFAPEKAPANTTHFVVMLKSRICDFFHTDINLSATVNEPNLAIKPNPIDFINVWPGDTLIKDITLKNNSKFALTINKLSVSKNPNIYIISRKLPFTLKQDSSTTFPILFIGKRPGKYLDSLNIYYSSICDYKAFALLNSSVSEEVYDINLSIRDYISYPNKDLTISISLDKAVPKFRPDSMLIQLSFDKWLFNPLQVYYVSNTEIIQIPSSLRAGFVQLHIPKQFADTMFLTDGKKLNIKGFTYPSSPNKTDLTFSNVKIYTDKVVQISKHNGSLEIIPVCHPIAKMHLILTGKISLRLKNSIISEGDLSLVIKSTAATKGTISIYSANGALVQSDSRNFINGKNDWNINMTNFANGNYYFILFSSTGQVFTHKFIVIR